YGPPLDIDQLLKDLLGSDLDKSSKETLLKQLPLINRLTSKQEYLLDVLEQRGPTFVLLESPYLPQEMILPLQVVMMNVWTRVLRSGLDPHRIFCLDELLKYLINEALMDYLEAMAAE